MQGVIDAVEGLILDHWTKFVVGALFMVLGWMLGKYRARQQWRRREFLNRLNISLNTLQNNRLLIRTLYEGMLSDVILNSTAEANIIQAARKTSEANPLLEFPKEDYWHYLNPVLNQISEQFSEGLLRKDMGQQVACATYLICLTCENAGDLRTRKVRAMVIQKAQLANIDNHQPDLDRMAHKTRWETVKKLSAEYQKNPWKFLEMEICV